MSDGACISRASAECGEEKPWNTRARYARRSMAQTRATGKACRLAFSWVMSLAGYEPTPFEEMPSEPVVNVVPQPIKPSPVNDDTRPNVIENCINPKQRQMLEGKIAESGLSRERIKSWVERSWKIEHFNALTNQQLNQLLIKIGQWVEAEKILKAREVKHETI